MYYKYDHNNTQLKTLYDLQYLQRCENLYIMTTWRNNIKWNSAL